MIKSETLFKLPFPAPWIGILVLKYELHQKYKVHKQEHDKQMKILTERINELKLKLEVYNDTDTI